MLLPAPEIVDYCAGRNVSRVSTIIKLWTMSQAKFAGIQTKIEIFQFVDKFDPVAVHEEHVVQAEALQNAAVTRLMDECWISITLW